MSRVDEILNVWFREPSHPDFGRPRKEWFIKSQDFDQLICDRFHDDVVQAAAGNRSPWQDQPHSCLALLLCLDQFPRNLFRGTPRAFATDPQALTTAKHAIAHQFDRALLPVQCWFVYLPFEHSESWADQQRSLDLWQRLKHDPDSVSAITYAQRHADVIRQFGRFPHRNAILGRDSTPAEITFLQQPGSSF